MLLAAILLGLIIAGLVFYRWPQAGLFSLVVSLPLERIGTFSLSDGGHPVVRVSQLLGLALIAASFGRLIMKKQKARYLPMNKWLFGLASWSLVPVAIINYGPLWQDYAAALFVLLLSWVVAQSINAANLKVIAKAVLASGILVGLFGVYQFLGGSLGWPNSVTGLREAYSSSQFGFPRIHGPSAEPLFYANWLLMPLLLSLAILLTAKSKHRGWAMVCFSLTAINLLLTTSRGGWLAAILGGMVLAILLFKRKQLVVRNLGLLALGSILVVLLGLTGIGFASWRTTGHISTAPKLFIEQTLGIGSTASYNERQQAVDSGFGLLKQQPLWGIGIGGVGYRLNDYTEAAASANRIALNNQYLEIAVEIGFVGLLIYLALLTSLLSKGFEIIRGRHKQAAFFASIFLALSLAILLQLLTFSGFFITYIWVVFGIMGGLAAFTKRLDFGQP